MKKRILLFTILLTLILSTISIGASNIGEVRRDGFAEGYFIEYKNGAVILESYSGSKIQIPFGLEPELLIDGRPVKFTDFRSGMEVYLEVQGRNAHYMDAFSASNPGYIQPGTKTAVGTVKLIDRDQIQLALPTGEDGTYFLNPGTLIRRGKINVPGNALYVGDNVKLTFDDANSPMISRMDIEGDSVMIKNLYRAKMASVDPLVDNINFENADELVHGSWTSLGKGFRLGFNPEISPIIGGMEIPRNNLKYYNGKTAYLAIKDNFGRDRVEKMVVKNNYENSYSAKIENINWYSSQIELSNKKNITINEGTMVIKNGRLVDIHSLNPKSDGLVITDGRGPDQIASVIYIYNEDLNNSNIGQDHIYSGRMDRIFQDRLQLRDFFLLNKNEWESFADDKELYYDQETFIYDLDNKKEVSPKEFFSAKYSVDEDERDDSHSRDWYGDIYTDGDRASVIFLKKKMDPLLQQRTTTGTVETALTEDPHMGPRITLRDSKDWSSSHEEWKMKNSSLFIYLKDAMIVKNGKRVKIEDIQIGDRLYMTRDSNMAKVVVIK